MELTGSQVHLYNLMQYSYAAIKSSFMMPLRFRVFDTVIEELIISLIYVNVKNKKSDTPQYNPPPLAVTSVVNV